MRPPPWTLITALAITILLAAGCAGPSPAATTTTAGASTCTEHSVPVALAPHDPTAYRIVGWLCLPNGNQPHAHTIQLLVSGLTYSHNYWDTTYQPETYSYVRAANEHGYATFNIDRLGTGKSDRPPAQRLTLQTHAYAISQIIAYLRTGGLASTKFTTVIGVGHSLGAGILQYEAGTVEDPVRLPNYLILTGYLTKANPDTITRIGAALYPGTEDPILAPTHPPTGYLTTRPGTRQIFLDPTDTDPAMTASDEQHKATTTLAERTTVSAARDPAITRAIHVPVLMIVGEHDLLACSNTAELSCTTATAIETREGPNFSERACLTAYVLPGAGHAINLHRNAHHAYDYSNTWLDTYAIKSIGHTSTNGCP